MIKNIFIIIALTSASFILNAQKKKLTHQFQSINSVALVNGNNSVSTGLQTVNGFKKDSWFAGVGVGIDYYLYRTVPLFGDLRYEFGKKKNKYFAYADAGINFSWIPDQFIGNPSIWNGNTSNSFNNGIYNDIGLGYNVRMKKEGALVLSLGYSHKNLKETESYIDWRTSELLKRENSYNLRRVMLKIGWQF